MRTQRFFLTQCTKNTSVIIEQVHSQRHHANEIHTPASRAPTRCAHSSVVCRSLLGLLWILTVQTYVAGQLPVTHKSVSTDKFVGYQNCQKCHSAQIEVLQRHEHFASFRDMHRSAKAKKIAANLGERSIKRSQRCIKCHYSPAPGSGGRKAAAGISCESCHGPASDWILKHNDYGGPNITKEMESAAHRDSRVSASIQAGMRHPSNLYLLARSCFGCHVIDEEDIVNAGHKASSQDFNLVSWSQGKMRHNFYRTGGKFNAKSDANRLRVMYVTGVLTDLEFSLRATAKAQNKTYAVTQAKRCLSAQRRLNAIAERTPDRFVAYARQAGQRAKFKSDQLAILNEIADAIGSAAFAFAASNDGSNLASIDELLPKASEYR